MAPFLVFKTTAHAHTQGINVHTQHYRECIKNNAIINEQLCCSDDNDDEDEKIKIKSLSMWMLYGGSTRKMKKGSRMKKEDVVLGYKYSKLVRL